ncbi:MAG: cytidylyltransferase domain-containing protein [Dissulfuribacterales bacterium]
MKVVALLPMKSHSERVPNKNISDFAGRPLYHYVAGILEASEYVERIIIDTDSEFIAEDAPKHFTKVEIVDRPESLCGDFVSMNDIIAHDIVCTDAEYFLQTHSTNPLLTKETLERAIETYCNALSGYDSLFSVTRYHGRFYRPSGESVNHNPHELLRTQDLPPLFEENSNLYLFSRESFVAAGNKRIGLKPFMFEMDRLEAIDIDEKEDWVLAEVLYELRGKDKL